MVSGWEVNEVRRWKTDAGRVMGNWRTALVFELVYKLAAALVLVPLLSGSFALAMRWSGHPYLTHENVYRFLREPITLLAACVSLTAVSGAMLIDVGAVAFLLAQSMQGRRVRPTQVLRFALQNAGRAFRPKNLPLVSLVLLTAPFVHLGTAAVFFMAVSVPAPVKDYLARRPSLVLAAGGAILVLLVLGAHWVYTAVSFTLEGCSFHSAGKRCALLRRGRRLHDLAWMLAAEGVYAAVSAAALLALTALAKGLGGVMTRVSGLDWLGAAAIWSAVMLTLALTLALAVPAAYGCAGLLYLRNRERAGESAPSVPVPEAPVPSARPLGSRVLKAAAVAVIAAGGLAILLQAAAGRSGPEVEYLHAAEITAHRGASANYPENTMSAFYGAAELGADWIELDVQQSGDGQLVVAHDGNLKRVTGVDANVWDMTYEQIAALDAGVRFGAEHAGERIPLLAEVLAFAGENGVKLNIELKPTGHERDLERAVVDAIRAAEMEDECVVTSQSYRVLENVKAYDETITTVYVMRFAYGNVGALSAADHLSVEAVSVTRQLVTQAHNAGKQLYVWTVNTRRSIENMIELNVDNIITDDVDLAKQCVIESRYSDMLEEYIDMLE